MTTRQRSRAFLNCVPWATNKKDPAKHALVSLTLYYEERVSMSQTTLKKAFKDREVIPSTIQKLSWTLKSQLTDKNLS